MKKISCFVAILILGLSSCQKTFKSSDSQLENISDIENFLAKSLSVNISQISYNSKKKEFLVNSQQVFKYDEVYNKYILANEYQAKEKNETK
jgi:hypothetical protein